MHMTPTVTEWKWMARECNNDLCVSIRQVRHPLLEPAPDTPDGMNILLTTPPTMQAMSRDAAIAAAASATVNANDGDLDICFCAGDGPTMELVQLTCCQQMIHKQCLLAYLGINTWCPYCRSVPNLSQVLELPVIDRLISELTPTMPASKKFDQAKM